MRLKNVDWKKFLLEKGERVALYGCLGIMALMLLLGLFMPGKGVFSGSAAENADNLQKKNKSAEDRIRDAKPDPKEVAELTFIEDGLKKSGELVKTDAKLVRSNGPLYLAPNSEDNKRRRPKVLEPVEYAAVYTQLPVPKYIFEQPKNERILVLQTVTKSAGPRKEREDPKQFGKRFGAEFGKGFGGQLPPGLGPNVPRPENPEFGGSRPEDSPLDPKKDAKPRYVHLNELQKLAADARLAEDILPLRMIIVVGSVPLREQVLRFKKDLRLQSIDQVFADRVELKGSQFRYKGLIVVRRVTGPDGKLVGREWEPLPVESTYKPLYLWTGNRWAEEKSDLKQLIDPYPGLVMSRPMHKDGLARDPQSPGMREGRPELQPPRDVPPRDLPPRGEGQEGQPVTAGTADLYPDIERQLPTIHTTLAELKKLSEESKPIVPRDRRFFPDKDFDPYNPNSGEELPEQKDPEKPPKEMREGEFLPPEHIPLRFLDVDVQPGHTYEYRLKIRMVNPNYNYTHVINPEVSKGAELLSDEFEVKDEDGKPLKITVPAESHFYASEVQAGLLKNQVNVQFHKWLDYITTAGAKIPFSVGDWVVADKVVVNRGEYMTRTDNIEVPVWMYTQSDYILATNPKHPNPYERQKVPLTFSPSVVGDSLLVDFQGGSRTYNKPGTPGIIDKSPVELIYLSPDGKLLARDSETDKRDSERERRLKEYRQRVEKIKAAQKPKEKPGEKP